MKFFVMYFQNPNFNFKSGFIYVYICLRHFLDLYILEIFCMLNVNFHRNLAKF
jgi:hypothetical protein